MVINVNKPESMTSRDVVNIICKHLMTKKVGHTGTLDPIATGVLVICTNDDTKLVEILTANNKEYEAVIKLGIQTDTGDITGNVIQKCDFNVTHDTILSVLNSFVKTYNQTVPKYSAVKINGKKLYEYARCNQKIELPAREVTIHSIELLEYIGDTIKFKVSVSKGTYIRSLIEDICTELQTVGTMQSLIRTKQGNFSLEDSNTLEDIANNNYNAIPTSEVLSDFEVMEIPEEHLFHIRNGAVVPKFFHQDKIVLMHDNEIIAIYQEYAKDKTMAKPYKMLKKNNT